MEAGSRQRGLHTRRFPLPVPRVSYPQYAVDCLAAPSQAAGLLKVPAVQAFQSHQLSGELQSLNRSCVAWPQAELVR